MIKVLSVDGIPEYLPKNTLGNSHFDGDFFYFFESIKEKDKFYLELPEPAQEEIKKQDVSNIDIKSLTVNQVEDLKEILGLK